MAFGQSKVWDIGVPEPLEKIRRRLFTPEDREVDEPRVSKTRTEDPPPVRSPRRTRRSAPIPATSTAVVVARHAAARRALSRAQSFDSFRNSSWQRVLSAYALGPLALPFLLHGRMRLVWSLVGLGSVVTGVAFARKWGDLVYVLNSTPYGGALFLTSTVLTSLVIAIAWVRALIAVSETRVAEEKSSLASRPWFAVLAGLALPGLGLHIAGRPKRAIVAFATVALLAPAALILMRSRWLWHRSLSDVPAGVAGVPLEVTLVLAAITAAVATLVWLVQALEGARFISPDPSPTLSGIASLALVVSMGIFFVTFRPAPLAERLHAGATELRGEHMQIVPLAMWQVAAKLDPATPAYLANAAELLDNLGREGAALSVREVLAERTREYLGVFRRDDQIQRAATPGLVPVAPSSSSVEEAGLAAVPVAPGGLASEADAPIPLSR